MMKMRLESGLPFVSITVTCQQQSLGLDNVLIDTGSVGSIFSADRVAEIGIFSEPHDTIYRIRGVGGAEFVFAKNVDRLSIGELVAYDFEIEVGAMNYGFAIDGIIGMDFLRRVRAVLDLSEMVIYRS